MVIIFRCETLLRAITSLTCGPFGIRGPKPSVDRRPIQRDARDEAIQTASAEAVPTALDGAKPGICPRAGQIGSPRRASRSTGRTSRTQLASSFSRCCVLGTETSRRSPRRPGEPARGGDEPPLLALHQIDPARQEPKKLEFAVRRRALTEYLREQPELQAELAGEEVADLSRFSENIDVLTARIVSGA